MSPTLQAGLFAEWESNHSLALFIVLRPANIFPEPMPLMAGEQPKLGKAMFPFNIHIFTFSKLVSRISGMIYALESLQIVF